MEKQDPSLESADSPFSDKAQEGLLVCTYELPETSGRSAGEPLRRIALQIQKLPDLEPPSSLLSDTMAAIQRSRMPWWSRAYRWMRAPRSITYSPLQAIPAVIVLAIVCLASLFYGRSSDHQEFIARKDQAIPVILSIRAPTAKSVAVVGSFNNWQPHSCELHKKNGEGMWTITLLLPAGRYEYAFLVDGEALTPATSAGFQQDDGFGNQNNFLLVGKSNETSM